MRLIDANALIAEMHNIILEDGEDRRTFYEVIERQPTIEPKKGKWVWSDEDASWKCGSCDCVFEEIDWKPEYNFCPSCGARMEE